MNANSYPFRTHALGALLTAVIAVGPVEAVDSQDSKPHSVCGLKAGWCQYPHGRPRPSIDSPMASVFTEIEPNDTPAFAQVLPLGDGSGEDQDIDVIGSLSTGDDTDFFQVSLAAGDIIGAATLGEERFDTVLAVTSQSGDELIVNNDHGDMAYLYPASSPFPGGAGLYDSALTWVAPTSGVYLLRVTTSYSSPGAYTLELRWRRPYLEGITPSVRQTLFIDFDGETIDAQTTFGAGESNAVLSPLSAFLPDWGLTAADEDAVIDAILAEIEENLADLQGVVSYCDYDLRNSRDHGDPFGYPYVSRVIVGGTASELGIPTLGIAESIDPGNFGTEETAVVLLGRLSASSGLDSINTIPRADGVSIIDVIGRVVGNITTHEMGHYLGNWHTENGNEIECLIDRGGNGVRDEAGVGEDEIFGTADDVDVDFVTDEYEAREGIADGIENSHVRAAYGLASVPLPELTVYVDAAHSGYEDGTLDYPFDTFTEGLDSLPDDVFSLILITGGSYPETVTVDQPIVIRRFGGGPVRIGD